MDFSVTAEIDLILDHVFGRGKGVDRRLGLARALRVLSDYVYPVPSMNQITESISGMNEVDVCSDVRGLDQVMKLNNFQVKGDWVGCVIKHVKGEEVDQASIDEVLSWVVRIAFAKHLQSLDVSNSNDNRMFC
jgi:hypothetical protein